MAATVQLSVQQQAIVEEGRTGNGSILIEALAGTGKTFTLLQLLRVLRGSTALTAFNNKIAEELEEKVTKAGITNARVGTCHKYGFEAVRKAMPGIRLEGKGKGRAGYYKFDKIAAQLNIPSEMQGFVKKAVSLAKQRAIGFLCAFNDREAWLDLVFHYSLDEALFGDEKNGHVEHDPVKREAYLRDALQFACKALKLEVKLAIEEKICNFDDMIYLPLVLGMEVQKYDNVLVDEAQDTNPARRELVKAMLKPNGRAIFVGDRNQAIYHFAGADNDSLDVIQREFACKTLPLTMTYRCAKAVVAVAQQFVPEYEAFETNNQGSYVEMDETAFDAIQLNPVEDAIICRNTKPLIDVAFGLIRRGIACRVEGKDIGKDLIKLVKRFERRSETLSELEDNLVQYRDEESDALNTQGKEMAAESLCDRVDTILAIIGFLPRHAEITNLIAKIDEMFEDTKAGEVSNKVLLMTLHRSKGLEWKRVFIWGRNKFCPSKRARTPDEVAQEAHLQYVGITRAIDTLVDVAVY